jgi:hypothetical protein
MNCRQMQKTESEIVVAYISVTNGGNTESYTPRFTRSYQEFPPGIDHELVVVANGGPLRPHIKAHWNGIDCRFMERVNDGGQDISGYQDVASHTDKKLIVCFGESIYFHRAGWLARIAEAWKEWGPGFYGFFSSHYVRAHLNTTAFACDPLFLRKYPFVKTHAERYAFEHGKHALWRRVVAANLPAALVTWDGVWEPGRWREPDNIMMRGDQSGCLFFCNHTDRWENKSSPESKKLLSAMCDEVFR